MEAPNRQSILGGVLILFGVLFSLRAFDVIDSDNILLSVRMYPLYAAVAFYIGKENRYAIACLALAAIMWFDEIYRLFSHHMKYLWPLALIIFGVLLITGKINIKKLSDRRKKDQGTDEQDKDGEENQFKL